MKVNCSNHHSSLYLHCMLAGVLLVVAEETEHEEEVMGLPAHQLCTLSRQDKPQIHFF